LLHFIQISFIVVFIVICYCCYCCCWYCYCNHWFIHCCWLLFSIVVDTLLLLMIHWYWYCYLLLFTLTYIVNCSVDLFTISLFLFILHYIPHYLLLFISLRYIVHSVVIRSCPFVHLLFLLHLFIPLHSYLLHSHLFAHCCSYHSSHLFILHCCCCSIHSTHSLPLFIHLSVAIRYLTSHFCWCCSTVSYILHFIVLRCIVHSILRYSVRWCISLMLIFWRMTVC